MAELLLRGWNAATPEVDTGDDIFVVHDADGQLIRVQVKTANVNTTGGQDTALFTVSHAQLVRPTSHVELATRERKNCLDSDVEGRR